MNYESVYVICPFYEKHEGHMLQCEGMVSMYSTQKFDNKKDMKSYMMKYCNTFNYGLCPYAQALETWHNSRKKHGSET